MLLKWTYLSLAILMILSFNTNANPEKILNSQFKTAYYSYQNAVKSKDEDAQFKYAKEAYQLGNKFYGETNINTANLALILAQQHLNKKQKKLATPLLLSTLNIFKREHGNNAIELPEIYILLGQSLPHNKRKRSIGYYLKALDISEDLEKEHPYFNAEIQLEAGIVLLRLGSRKSNVILSAQKFFTENLPKNDKRVVNSNFYAGKYNAARQKYSKAIENWQANLPVFESLEGATHPLELSTHAFLIDALEKSGKSDEATKHCIAIGSMTPWNDSQEQRPLFRTNPKYPASNARRGKEGWVKVGFTISDFGTVTDAKILDSEGGRGFEKSSLAVLEEWRYAPKFEDGKPIEAYATVQLDFSMN
ncbi:MAG: TonB family protein [Colwellia sp.]|jgi:TonB family protein